MTYGRKALHGILLLAVVIVAPVMVSAQQSEGQSCAEKLTEQLRRFSEKCLADLVSYVASQPKMAAKIFGETEKYYIVIAQEGGGLRAEAVSKFNYPLMKEETAGVLKQLGWHPPENESDNWKKHISGDRVRTGAAAEDLAKALAAYGLSQGQAISLTVGTDISS
jgi:type III secretion system-like peptide-binding chaperone